MNKIKVLTVAIVMALGITSTGVSQFFNKTVATKTNTDTRAVAPVSSYKSSFFNGTTTKNTAVNPNVDKLVNETLVKKHKLMDYS